LFDADRPILKSEQDQLDRATFAKYLARCMLDHKDTQSLVVGLYGGWGVGKTSIINLIYEELNFAATNLENIDKPIILNFSPWSYSGQNQLIYSFFRRLSSTLRQVDYLENADQIIHLLELYVSYFTRQPIPKSFRTKKSFWKKMRESDETYAWETGKDLTLIKAELNQLLSKQKHKIIIMIDNISRLYDYEIKQIFQIVKSMGDYTNTVYLLVFDKDHVVKLLNKMDGFGGEEYVEKVVQLPFEVPPILQHNLEKIFFDRIGAIINTVPLDSWNNEYWFDVYYNSLKYLFKNCRDITRYVNTVNFGYSRLRDVVNPVDFFAITALEVFAPKIYTGIRDNKDLFTDLLDNVYELNKTFLEKDKIRCDEIFSRNTELPNDLIQELVMQLFPRIRQIYQSHVSVYHSAPVARKLKRICSPDMFDAYFRLSIQIGQIPLSEFNTIIELASDRESFVQALTRLNQDNRISQFLDQLDNKRLLSAIPQKQISAIVAGLLDNGDLFPQAVPSLFTLNMPMRINRIIRELLKQLKTNEERYHVLDHAVKTMNKSIYTAVYTFQQQEYEQAEESDTFIPVEYRDLNGKQLNALRINIVEKIKFWAKDDRLVDHPYLLPLLIAWRDWGNETECLSFVNEMVTSDRGLIAFLLATLKQPIDETMHAYRKDSAWEKYLDLISSFASLTKLENHAKLLFEDNYFEKLREREQLAILIFLDLIKAPTQKTIPQTSA